MAGDVLSIWITGGGSGIGAALARHYAAQGHRVIISGRNAQKLQEISEGSDGHIQPLVFDVSDDDASTTTSQALQELTTHLDLLIMNAGSCEYIRAPELDTALFRRVMDSNYFGMINTLRAALPLLREAPHRPHVVGICSLAGLIGFPRAAAYGGSKAAAAYLVHALRTDFGDLLDTTVVNPGFIRTPMTEQNRFPMPFLMEADKAAALIARRIRRRPMTVNFPRRLSAILQLGRLFAPIWYRMYMRSADSLGRKKKASGK